MREILVRVEAAEVDEDDFEDLLATDSLFIEYFNQYLALPTFPEPLSFNRESGGFEVKSPEKQVLAKAIKAAVRAGKRRKRIYRPVHAHSYSDIPLIPIEDQPYAVAKEINTSFTVKTLNKEQGIQWIKLERLPTFLTSDCYIEYRLAKLISQAQVSQKTGEYIIMKLDHKPLPKKNKDKEEEKEPEVDVGELMLKQCYVCMGNASTTDTEAWVSQAKLSVTPATTTTSSPSSGRPTPSIGLPRPPSGGHGLQHGRPGSGRPTSATSPLSSGRTSRVADSGIWSPTKSMFGSSLTDHSNYTNSIMSENEDDDKMAAIDEDPSPSPPPRLHPRPSDSVCEVVEDGGAGSESRARVYTVPIVEEVDEIEEDIEEEEEEEMDIQLNNVKPETSTAAAPELTKPVESPAIGGDQDSDEDVLLDSDDDYEDERDSFFRMKKKDKVLNVVKAKGIEAFKKFLSGTNGEKNWLMWMDIERARSIELESEISRYLAAMRSRYQKTGAPFELPWQTKKELGLIEPSHWTQEKLYSIQSKMAEPLVLYWAPRFLLREKAKVKPERNFLYHHQKQLSTTDTRNVFPSPPTISMLPLRPKSCMPRLNQEKPQVQISDAYEATDSFKNHPVNIPKTTPPTGMRRSYQLPEMFQPPPDKKEEKEKENEERRRKHKTPKQLVKSQMSKTPSRPPSAPARLGSGGQSNRRVRIDNKWESASDAGSRPSSSVASSRRSSVTSCSEDADFAGGRRMEGLLQALSNEKKSGEFIRRYVKEAGNDLWSNSLSFWEAVQGYHKMFYADIIDSFSLQTKAKEIYSLYIVSVGAHSIRCSSAIRESIHYHLIPPYEELFDEAEEYALSILFDAWTQMLFSDISTFDKLELIEEKRHLNTKSKYMVTLQRRGIIKDRPPTPDDNHEDFKDPVYDQALGEKVPEEFRDWSLEKLVHNRIELEHFRQFLADNYASMDLLCWMDIEAFKRLPHSDEKRRDMKCKDIKVKYFNKKYFFGPNSPAGKEGQEKVMQAGGGWGKLLEDRPPTASLLEAQRYVRERLEKKWLPLFLATETFEDRQHVVVNLDDAVEDVLIQRKKKSQAIWKMLESKWVSSSKDIITFRKALQNPVSSLQFRKFVSIKGDHFENDVLFWQEVQKYKDLCHLHSDRSLVQQKTSAIIHCFVDSPIPPSLQIDITQEMADKIVERKLEASPYLFREAQLTVFRVLFNQWSDFCNFRTNLTEDKLMTTIERHRRKARAEEKKKQREIDDKKTKEDAKRKALGLPAEGEDAEDYDPFAKAAGGGGGGGGGLASDDEGLDGGDNKAAVSWSYSKYMKAFDQEEVMNEVDEETFSSLTGEDTSSKASFRPTRMKKIGKSAESGSQTEKARKSKPVQNGRPFSGSVHGSNRSKMTRGNPPMPSKD